MGELSDLVFIPQMGESIIYCTHVTFPDLSSHSSKKNVFFFFFFDHQLSIKAFEPVHEKTNNLHRRKQRRRSAS